ncbi:MAG: HD domain-containing protein [Prolixibacteraceae bacterium]|nr:HD domain-containing protein [Prolixibacteraceae bacterium]
MALHAEENISNDFEISTESFNRISNAVFDYINSFTSEDEYVNMNLSLKREHINRVIGYSEVISRSLACTDHEVRVALLVALLHDIGRFEQFIKHRTFVDTESVDHAALAIEIIKTNGWLNELTPDVCNWIISAVENHNKRLIPKTEANRELFFSKIIRDADKIDIMDMAVKEYSKKNKTKNEAFTLGLEKSFAVSKPVIDSIVAGKLPDKKDLKTVNDFKLLQMAFVFDLNFKKSFTIVNQKQYLKQLFESLPKSDHIFDAYRVTKIHVENHIF